MADDHAFLDGRFQDMVVDDVHRQIFVSQESPAAVVAVDFSGEIIATLTGFSTPKDLSISPDGSAVYVAEHDTPSIGVIDTQAYTVGKVALPAEHCVWSTASTGGKLWYSYRDCQGTDTGSLGSYDPATGEITGGSVVIQAGDLRAFPNRPDRLFQVDRQTNQGAMHVYDVTGGTPVQVSASAPGSAWLCRDTALFAGGDKAALACTNDETYAVIDTADFSTETRRSYAGKVRLLAVSHDDRFVATGTIGNADTDTEPSLSVRNLQNDTFVARWPEYTSSYSVEGSVAFTADGKLIRVLNNSYESRSLVEIIDRAATGDTEITIDAPDVAGSMDTVRFSGTLHRGSGVGTVLSVQREDSTGSLRLPDVTVDEHGNFTFIDTPGRAGYARYTVSFAGDAAHRPAKGNKAVNYRGLRNDINGDGYVDVVAGAPGEDIGDDTDTGQIHLLYGSANGVKTAGNRVLHQDSESAPDSNEDGDRFGHAVALGDFDGDGYGDIAVSAPGEDSGSLSGVGTVFVFYGSEDGPSPWAGSIQLQPREPADSMAFGSSLAVGDFNGDHRDDLAIGAPGNYDGLVSVYSGTDGGMIRTREFRQSDADVPGSSGFQDRFGWALGAGDVDGDGIGDLAIGASDDREDGGSTSGAVTVLKGRAIRGLGTTGAQRFTKDTPGVPGASTSFNTAKGDLPDMFGHAVALADFNGDGKDDLAVGAPGSAVTGTDGKRKDDAGTVTVLYSDGTTIGTTGAVELTQKTVGVPGNPGGDDRWGATITAGDSDHDGRAELAVSGGGEEFVTVVPGGATGLTGTGAIAWSQDSPGVPGGIETGDRFGASIRFADIKGSGYLSLIVGAPGEDTGAGAFVVLYGTASGVTGTGSTFISQDTEGIPGAEEKNDGFGTFN